MKDKTYIYRLPLDQEVDKDIIEWINSFPSKKKAEVVRYALRYYISQLHDNEIFIMPESTGSNKGRVNNKKEEKKKPKISLLKITDTDNK